ncbi:MAG: dTMP kinase [Gammaproteobacteria bacterium]|nr:dTMP kinase [Gammaproteobacteria bacterium]
MKRGKFITIEGQDGAGKSTNIASVLSCLETAAIETVVTREPGGTPLGETLRDVVLGSQDADFGDMAELLLIFAARAQHIAEVIEPALAKGHWVLCDRFTDATFAYQGGGRGIKLDKISALERLVQGDLQPDLTLLLDVPVDVGVARAGQRSEPDRFERQQDEFKSRVRSVYLKRAESYSERFKLIDASQSIQEVQTQVVQVMTEFIMSNGK